MPQMHGRVASRLRDLSPPPAALASGVAVLVLLILVAAAVGGALPAFLVIGAAAGLLLLSLLGSYRTAILVLMLAFGTAPMYKGLAASVGSVVTPTDLLMVLGLVLLVPTLIVVRLHIPIAYSVGIVLLFVMAFTASAAASDPLRSFMDLVQLLAVAVIFPLALTAVGGSRTSILLLAGSYVFGQLLSLAFAFIRGPVTGNRYQGLSHHPNAFSEAGLMAVALLLYLFYRYRSWWWRGAVLGAIALCGLSVIMSGSRAATVVCAVLIVMVPFVERSTASVVAFMALLAGIFVSLPLILHFGGEGSAIHRLTGAADALVADSARDEMLTIGWHRFLGHPLAGTGFQDVELMHNVFLETLVAVGVVGTIGFVMMMITLALPLFGGGIDRRLAYTAWAYIGLGPTVPGLEDRTLWVPLALAMLAAVRPVRHPEDESSTAEGGARHGDRPELAEPVA